MSSILALLVLSAPLVAQSSDHLVDGSRPLDKAVNVIETRCQCVVTYEERVYDRSALVDWTSVVRRDGKQEPKIFGPPARSFRFTSEGVDAHLSVERLRGVLTTLVNDFNRSDMLGGYALTETYSVFHVVPGGNAASILSVRITTPPTTASAWDMIGALLAAVNAATGKKVGMATVPKSLLMRAQIREASQGDTAEQILTRILAATNLRLSWQLYYDYNMELYGLNIHAVE